MIIKAFYRMTAAALLLASVMACNEQPAETLKNEVSTAPESTPVVASVDASDAGAVVTETAAAPREKPLPTISSASEPEDSPFQEINWEALMPDEFKPEVVLDKYMALLADLDDADPKGQEIFLQMQKELENAPINEDMNQLKIKLPGFIAPLENTDGKVSEFLLVPYYGACIHVPPPPVNQTVLIKTLPESAIKVDNIWDPIWVMGELRTEGERTAIGTAGYRIVDARVKPFE